MANWIFDKSCNSIAVSYTHLDVYKRQKQGHGMGMIIMKDIIQLLIMGFISVLHFIKRLKMDMKANILIFFMKTIMKEIFIYKILKNCIQSY